LQIFYIVIVTKPFLVTSAKQLQVIASPGREEIMDVVSLIGPCSITELAGALGRSRNSLYYHVRALRDCGLLVETQRSREGQKRTAYYDPSGRPLAVHFDLSTKDRKRAVIALARARIRSAARGFERACRPGAVLVEGSRRNLWATHLKGWLSDEELEEANELFARLIHLIGRSARESVQAKRSYEFTFVLAPIFPKK
jgi:DNA-binding transcriptional ArsR family regulator